MQKVRRLVLVRTTDQELTVVSIGFVMHSTFTNSIHFAIAITYRPLSRCTYALVLGLPTYWIQYLSRCLSQRNYLPTPTLLPVFLPLLLVEWRALAIGKRMETSHDRIYGIEGTTGIRTTSNSHRHGFNVIVDRFHSLTPPD
jgi:hypothetical protein